MTPGLLVIAVLASAPVLTLGEPDPGGCARTVRQQGRELEGGPRAFCIEQVLSLELEGVPSVVLRVAAPHRFEGRVRSRVFVYRLEQGRLVPRFLGSGFWAREVTGLFVLPGALGLETLTTEGEPERLSCTFDGFPLVCSELKP